MWVGWGIFEGVFVEVTSTGVLICLVAFNFLFSIFAFYTLNLRFQELPDNEFGQLTEIQHILMGIGQYLEAKLENLNEMAENPLEKMKQMIPLLIGQKFFPQFFGGEAPQPSLTASTPKQTIQHGEERLKEEE